MIDGLLRVVAVLSCLMLLWCGDGGGDGDAPGSEQTGINGDVRVLLLHHSTGQNVWDGGVPSWLETYNDEQGTSYGIGERSYPDSPWPWDNYPSDYYRLWVEREGSRTEPGTEWLESMTEDYDVIIFKHCFPGGDIEPDAGQADPASGDKTLENYRAAYDSLKTKLQSFPDTRFIVWTLAIRTQAEMAALFGAEHTSMAERAREFVNWTKATWDEPGDNIYVWDFYALETEGSLYLRPEHAADPGGDSHPNATFCEAVAPLLGQRIVDVIEGRGDTASLTGQ